MNIKKKLKHQLLNIHVYIYVDMVDVSQGFCNIHVKMNSAEDTHNLIMLIATHTHTVLSFKQYWGFWYVGMFIIFMETCRFNPWTHQSFKPSKLNLQKTLNTCYCTCAFIRSVKRLQIHTNHELTEQVEWALQKHAFSGVTSASSIKPLFTPHARCVLICFMANL